MYCAAFNCAARFGKNKSVTFHGFPKDEEIKMKWAKAVRRENFQPNSNSKLCSQHFTPADFDRERFGGMTWLKKGAVPSIFNFTPSDNLRQRKKLGSPEQSTTDEGSTVSAVDPGPETTSNDDSHKSQSQPYLSQQDGTKKRTHKCSDCDLFFRRCSDLKRHRLVHTGERPFHCTTCDKSFSRSTNLNKHLKIIHSGEKSHPCTMCPKLFSSKGDMQRHLLTHSGAKEFVCDACPRRFSRRDKLTRHQILHIPSDKRPAFPCDICGKNFVRKSTLTKHRLNHTGDKPLQCPKCPKSYASNWELQRHVVTHSQICPFVCSLCSKGFYKKDKLARHVKLHYSLLSTQVSQHSLEPCSDSIDEEQWKYKINSEGMVFIKQEVEDNMESSNNAAELNSDIEVAEEHLIKVEPQDVEYSFGDCEVPTIKSEVGDKNWVAVGTEIESIVKLEVEEEYKQKEATADPDLTKSCYKSPLLPES